MKNRRKQKAELNDQALDSFAKAFQRTVPVSVTMIVRNAEKSLPDTFASLKKNFLRPCDEIVVVDTGSNDKTVRVCEKHGARVIQRPDLCKDVGALVEKWLPEYDGIWKAEHQTRGGCVLDFAGARMVSMEAAANDCIFWLDSDDSFEEAQPFRLRNLIDEHFGEAFNFVYMPYYYSFDDKDGQVQTVLKRERVVDRRLVHWVGKCHETLIPRTPADHDKIKSMLYEQDAGIFHRHHRKSSKPADIRNYCIIRNEMEQDLEAGRTPDVRSIFYLGNACRGLDRFQEAGQMYRKALALSGSKDDRHAAAYYIAIMYLHPKVQRAVDARRWAYECIRIKPDDPRAYYILSRCAVILRQFGEALHWFQIGRSLPEPSNTFHTYDRSHITTLPYQVAITAAIELKRPDLVQQYMTELLSQRPNLEEVQSLRQEVENWLAGLKLVESVQNLVANTRCGTILDVQQRVGPVLSNVVAVPPMLEEKGIGKAEPEDARDGDEVVFFCGHTHEAWGPESRKTGIGGSEKMVLLMAPRLQRLGYRVSVYANVPAGQRGVDADGVNWRHWAEFDYQRPRGTVIFWRSPGLLKLPIGCEKRIVWCHDVQNPAHWDEDLIALVDQVWVLSEYHATTLGPVREALGSKLRITRNAIDDDLFRDFQPKEGRKDLRVVYCSSPDRGVLTAIDTFKAAFPAERYPHAELIVCYGFTKMYYERAASVEYCHIPDVARDLNMYDYVAMVNAAAENDPRIRLLGRVNWQELADLMHISTAWLYPTRFPEISCMAAMEAQCSGLRCVSSDYAALAETVDWGFPFNYRASPDDIQEGARALFAACMTPRDDAEWRQVTNAKARFSAYRLAEEWSELIREE